MKSERRKKKRPTRLTHDNDSADLSLKTKLRRLADDAWDAAEEDVDTAWSEVRKGLDLAMDDVREGIDKALVSLVRGLDKAKSSVFKFSNFNPGKS